MQPRSIAEGLVAPGFEPCFDAFQAVLAEGGELGAACAVYWNGQAVVDLWGGTADPRSARRWERDTMVPVFSVTKGIAALCILQLVAQGRLELDQPVAAYWPEFGAHGKDRVTVREALAHRAGVPVLSGAMTIGQLRDLPGMAARLAAEAPLFEPGSAYFYHAITVGWITTELVRQTTGRSLGQWLRDEIAQPLGLNICIGRSPEHPGPVALVECPPELDAATIEPDSIAARSISLGGLIHPTAGGLAAAMNDPALQAVELAGVNGIADARSLARLYASVCNDAGGEQLIPADILDDACRITSQGPMWGGDIPGATCGAGLMLPFGNHPLLGPGSFGHNGAGGSMAAGHRPSGLGFAYVRNRMADTSIVDPRVYRIVRAVAECAGLPVPKVLMDNHDAA
ncbi:serine hydrolase domain-containing protein [Sphingomonas mali]|uniref:serine hydrolase domain-containing protein n=1 Tax=Sphingomonas mali TaxID=40682 RepID=UPI0009FE139D|nr:serine hydrolase domain-containing protein [Sphingomonas mali]